MSHLAMIETTVQKTHEWLRDVGTELGTENPRAAYSALRAVLHALRDHIETDEVAQLGAQLPTLIRGIYYEGWDPKRGVDRPRNRAEFLAAIFLKTKDHPELDDPEVTAKAVFDVLCDHVTGGELNQVVHELPKDIRQLWSESVE
jgi:uncharacterized protein (DUF2267 family)